MHRSVALVPTYFNLGARALGQRGTCRNALSMTLTAAEISAGLVPRSRLVGRLIAAEDTPLVLLVAPAGYGKTTLLAEWSMRDGRPFAWVDPQTPAHELRAVCKAFGQAAGVVVFDGDELLNSHDLIAVIPDLIERAGHGAQVAVAARREPALGLGGLRAARKLLELRSADLAMTSSEVAALAESHGLELDRAGLEQLLHRTEGWPAGLYLAALAASDGGDTDADLPDGRRRRPLPGRLLPRGGARAAVGRPGGLPGPQLDSRPDVRTAVRLRARARRFGAAPPGAVRTNLMLVPLDRRDREYRYHRLFAEALRGELRRREPVLERTLHGRASGWYGERGDVERAIAHAVEGGDVARAGDLLWTRAADIVGYGAEGRLERWLEDFSLEQVTGCPKLALAAAATALLSGDRELVERWTAAALNALEHGEEAEERAELAGEALLFRAAVNEDAVTCMGRQAQAASEHVPERSPWRPLGDLLQGVSRHLIGDRAGAYEVLEQGARHAAPGSPSLQALCLAQLALLAVEADDWEAAESYASRARAQVERSGFDRYPTAALVYAVSAEVHAHLGRVEASKLALDDAARLLSELPDFSPWYEAECSIAMARAALRLSDVQRARTLVEQAERLLRRSPDARVAVEWLRECSRRTVVSSATSAGDEWCLTTAELRILQYLPTYLSLREIAERLYVSANTVKTHARSVYRKLGASSRGDAVVRARDAGLLDEAFHAGVGSAAV